MSLEDKPLLLNERSEVANAVVKAVNELYKGRVADPIELLCGMGAAMQEFLRLTGDIGRHMAPLLGPFKAALNELSREAKAGKGGIIT